MRKQDMGKRQSCDKQGMRERFSWALYSLNCALHRKFPGFKRNKRHTYLQADGRSMDK